MGSAPSLDSDLVHRTTTLTYVLGRECEEAEVELDSATTLKSNRNVVIFVRGQYFARPKGRVVKPITGSYLYLIW